MEYTIHLEYTIHTEDGVITLDVLELWVEVTEGEQEDIYEAGINHSRGDGGGGGSDTICLSVHHMRFYPSIFLLSVFIHVARTILSRREEKRIW